MAGRIWKYLDQDERASLDGYRERRRGGKRKALDWQYNHRTYLFVLLVPVFGFFGGLDLMSKDPLWQRGAGLVLLLAMLVGVGLLLRWLLRPVDEASLQKVREYHESMKWRNIWKRG